MDIVPTRVPWSGRFHLIKNLLLGRIRVVNITYMPKNRNSLGITYPEITIVDKRSRE